MMIDRSLVRSAHAVILVDCAGAARVCRSMAEAMQILGARESVAGRIADALQAVKDRATPPRSCGSDIPVAPARGPMVEFTPREVVRTSAGGRRVQRAGYAGRNAARVADAFDRMTFQAQRAHPNVVRAAQADHDRRRAAGETLRDFCPPPFVPPFTKGQVNVARDYAALSERVAASGVKCSSVEALGAGGGGGDREVAMLRDFEALRVYHRRIGTGLAKEVRRIRPGGAKRRAITARRLVDMVCIGGATLEGVLEAHGWAVDQKSRNALRAALCAALERMRGYDLRGVQKGD